MASDKETDKPRARMEVDIPSEAFDVSGNRLTLTEDEEEEEESEGESLDLSFALVQPDNTNRLLCQAIYPSSGTLDNEAAKHQTVKECPVSNSQKNSYEKIIVISHTSKTHVHDLEGDMDKTELCRIIKSVEMDCEENSSNLKSSDRKRSSDTEVSTESPEGLKIPKGDLHLMKAFDLSSATRSKGNDFKDSSMSYFEGMKKDKWTESKQSAIISDTLVTHKVDVENKLGSLTDFKTMYGKNKEEFEENSSLPVEEISSRKNSENEQSSIDLDGQTIDNISVETSREQKLDLHKMLEKKDVDSEGLPSPSRESEGMTSSLIESNTGVSNFRKNGKATDLVGIIKATVNKYEEYAHSFDTGLASESVCETSISTVNPDTPVALSVGSQAELKMSILSKNRAFEEEEDTKCVPSSNKDLDIMWTATAEVVAIESETLVTHNSNLGTELEKPDHLSKLSNVVETQCEENLHLYGKYLNRGPGGTAEVTITGSATLMAYKADMDSEEGKKIDVNMANETSEDNAESLPFSGRQFRSHELDNRNGIPLLFMVDKVNVENRVEKMFSLQDISKVKDKDYSESFHSSNENSEMSQNFKTERKPTITDAVSTPVVVLQSTDGKSSDLSRLNETRKENNTECSLLSDGDSVREQYMPFKSVALPFSVTSTSGENVPHSYFHNNDTNVQMHVETVYEMLLDDEHYTSQKDQESLLSSQKCFIVDKAVFPFEETDVESKTEKVLDLSKADKSMKEDHDENVSDDQDLETKRNYVTEDDIGLLGGLIGEDDLLQKMEQKLSNIRKQIAEDQDEEDLEDEDSLESYDNDTYLDQENDNIFLKTKSHNIDISLDPEIQHLLDRHLLKQQLGSIEEEEEGDSEDLGTSEESEETEDIHITDPFKETVYQLDTLVEECESGDENRLCAGNTDDLNNIMALDQGSENENQTCEIKQEWGLDYVIDESVITNCTIKTTDQGVENEKHLTRSISEEQVNYVEGDTVRDEITTFKTEMDSGKVCQTQKYDSCCDLKDSTYEYGSIPNVQVELSIFQPEAQKESGSFCHEDCHITAYIAESIFQKSAGKTSTVLREHQLKDVKKSSILLKKEKCTPEYLESQMVSSLSQRLQTGNTCESVISELNVILNNNNSTDGLKLSMDITELKKPFKVEPAASGDNQKNIFSVIEASHHTVKRNEFSVGSWRSDLNISESFPFSSSVLEEKHDKQKQDDHKCSLFARSNENQQLEPHHNSEIITETDSFNQELGLSDSQKSAERHYFPKEVCFIPAAETDFSNNVKSGFIESTCNALEAYEALEKGASLHQCGNMAVAVAGASPLTMSGVPYSMQLERPTSSEPVQWQQQQDAIIKSTTVQETPWAEDQRTAVDEEKVKMDTQKNSCLQGEIQQPDKEASFCQTCCDLQASVTMLQSELQSLQQRNSMLENEVSKLKIEQSTEKRSIEYYTQPNVENSQSQQSSTRTMEQYTQTEGHHLHYEYTSLRKARYCFIRHEIQNMIEEIITFQEEVKELRHLNQKSSGLWKSAAKMGLVIASGLLFFWWITDHLS